MRLVHLSDLHLGFRRYDRLSPLGINQREADVALSFSRAIDKVVELKPDLVLVAGDVFHVVRPSNPSILHAHAEFSRLVRALPTATVVIIAGNHDAPRMRETGCILQLFAPLGISVVVGEAQRLAVPALDLSILAVPDMPTRPIMEPDPGAKYNVLLVHGAVDGILPHTKNGITKEEIGGRWDYIALGDFHVYQQVAPNAWYSGSIEYTSSNPWDELKVEKGLIEHDLASGVHTFHALPAVRAHVDIPAISGVGLSPAELDEAIRAAVESVDGGIDGKVVRLLVRDVAVHVARELDHKALRGYKGRAMNFNLDMRRPEIIRIGMGEAPAPRARRPSLEEMLGAKLLERAIAGDIDREGLVALGLHYLVEAEREDAGPGITEIDREEKSA